MIKVADIKVKVNNVPNYAAKYKYIVARSVDGELWFYGAYDTESRADDVARGIGGVVVERETEAA